MPLLEPHLADRDFLQLLMLGLGLIGRAIPVLVGIPGLIALYRWWRRPLDIKPNMRLFFDGGATRDEILATITNRSDKVQYVVRCNARSTYPLSTIIRRHLGHPTLRPRLYNTIRYGAQSFMLLNAGKTARLEPGERVELRHRLKTHWLSKFLAPMLLIEVELSDGRTFRSGRREVPERWRLQLPTQTAGQQSANGAEAAT